MHEKFHYGSAEDINRRAEELGFSLPFGDDTSVLGAPLDIGGTVLANRLGIAPMEGADSDPDGSPSELTAERYTSYAKGGAALIWFEAVSIVSEGRSSATQLLLDERNLDSYKRLIESVKQTGIKENGYEPKLVMQANHSGRYSNPDNRPAPMIAYHNPLFEKDRPVSDDCIVTDDYLKRLEEQFGKSAFLAREAGFDLYDVKSCHGYLLAELCSAYDRPGEYGGSFENRTRLLINGIKAAGAAETKDFRITSRIGIFDGFPYPYGFGSSPEGGDEPDLSEPVRLVRELKDGCGLSMINLTMGNPYQNTHVTRPYDNGKYIPDEHPLTGIHRMISGTGYVKKEVPEMVIYASAPSYLRQFSDIYASGAVSSGACDGMLFGRMSLADPDFPNEILKNGRIDPKRVCLTCGKCAELLRGHVQTGCVVRNSSRYLPLYRTLK